MVFLILIFLDKTGILKLCSAPIIKKKRGNDLHILFVNCCIRQKEKPRTLSLCRAFIKAYTKQNPKDVLKELFLPDTAISFFNVQRLNLRDELLAKGQTQASMFALANQFAAADKIIIGAPYWDLSFPALLKIYFENISVNGITFCYTEQGIRGLCRAQKLIYITTCGGLIGENNTGEQYIRGLCEMFGIKEFSVLTAQGLDIEGAAVRRILAQAEAEAQKAAEIW